MPPSAAVSFFLRKGQPLPGTQKSRIFIFSVPSVPASFLTDELMIQIDIPPTIYVPQPYTQLLLCLLTQLLELCYSIGWHEVTAPLQHQAHGGRRDACGRSQLVAAHLPQVLQLLLRRLHTDLQGRGTTMEGA